MSSLMLVPMVCVALNQFDMDQVLIDMENNEDSISGSNPDFRHPLKNGVSFENRRG